jgi:energy-converting hydrogenase Eha subunit H
MADHVVRGGGIRILRALLGLVAALGAAGAVVLAAIASFSLNPVGPALVALVAIVGGGLLATRTHEPILRSAGLGLVAGGALAVLLWPLFAVDSGGGIENGPSG